MSKYRKKPITIEAKRWNGGRDDELLGWLRGGGGEYLFTPSWVNDFGRSFPARLSIRTLEGVMEVSPGDWVIKGSVGEFYPCRGDVFESTYELVD